MITLRLHSTTKSTYPHQPYCPVSILITPPGPWKLSLHYPKMRHIASSHSFEPKYHVFPVPFLFPIVPSLPECDLNISSTHKTWPALFSGVKDLYPPFYGDPAFETSSHPTPSPQLSYPPLWSFLYLTSSGSPHFFHWKERGFIKEPSGGAGRVTQDQIRTT